MAFTHSGLLPAYLAGLTLSNDATSPNTVIDVAPGIAADDVNGILMPFPTAFTKTPTSTWAAGSGANGLDAGSPAASTWYHVFLIQKDADGSTDILFSLSATSPTMPSGYTNKRRIGAMMTDASTHILPFSQNGDEFYWRASMYDVNETNLSTTARTLYTLSVPTGLKVNALIRAVAILIDVSQGTVVTSPDENDQAPLPGYALTSCATQYINSQIASAGHLNVRTNTSSQIGARASEANSVFRVYTYGWIDTRGRLG